jgi:hypothetical protein
MLRALALLLAACASCAAAVTASAQTRTIELSSSREVTAGLDVSAVGYLQVDTGGRRNYGSASLIDSCHVKTAAHMFRSRKAGAVDADALASVSFGYERTEAGHRFASTHRITRVSFNPKFNPARTQQPGFDVAVARIEPCAPGAAISVDSTRGLDDIGQLSRRFAVVGFVPDAQLQPRLFAMRGCLWTGDGDVLGILLNCAGKSGMSGGSVFMADGAALVDIGVFTSSVSVKGRSYGAFSPLSANRAILP